VVCPKTNIGSIMDSHAEQETLTCNDVSRHVYDVKNKRIGAIIRLANGRYAAWSLSRKLDEYEHAVNAVAAVLAAGAERK
jgi:hypothetical protein